MLPEQQPHQDSDGEAPIQDANGAGTAWKHGMDADTADGEAVEPGAGKQELDHDPTGLDLARSIAGAYRGLVGRRRADAAGGKPRFRAGRRPSRQAGVPVSGAHPDERDPQSVGSSLQRLVAEQGWSTDLAVHALFGRWDSIVGAQLAEHCRPRSYTDTELTVDADSTAWATQVRLLAPTLLRRLNEELGHGTVTRIDVQGPKPPSWGRGRRSVRGGRGPRDTYG